MSPPSGPRRAGGHHRGADDPPISACDELEGSPSSRGRRVPAMAPASAAKTTVRVIARVLTMPLAIVAATGPKEGADEVQDRRQDDRRLRLQRAGRDRRRHRVGGVGEAVREIERQALRPRRWSASRWRRPQGSSRVARARAQVFRTVRWYPRRADRTEARSEHGTAGGDTRSGPGPSSALAGLPGLLEDLRQPPARQAVVVEVGHDRAAEGHVHAERAPGRRSRPPSAPPTPAG